MQTIEAPIWAFIQDRLGFSDDEMQTFKSNPQNTQLIQRGLVLQNKEIVFEFVEAHGCYSHNVGDRLVFDPLGNLIVAKCPERVCRVGQAEVGDRPPRHLERFRVTGRPDLPGSPQHVARLHPTRGQRPEREAVVVVGPPIGTPRQFQIGHGEEHHRPAGHNWVGAGDGTQKRMARQPR